MQAFVWIFLIPKMFWLRRENFQSSSIRVYIRKGKQVCENKRTIGHAKYHGYDWDENQ